ncbi:hypothetical protein Patl1_03083 [Pistacia atlantica]|uniref:Uncharacterized protein n=1 Tax=Pistacia atlantica TaxID=434234 RepID=A0ACC1C972_9ROSI|nr:hypothetical protein Patl1_03083 [Pistacia atlantica]
MAPSHLLLQLLVLVPLPLSIQLCLMAADRSTCTKPLPYFVDGRSPHMKKDARSVVEYSHEFKFVCDQLAAMGRFVDDLDKIHCCLPRDPLLSPSLPLTVKNLPLLVGVAMLLVGVVAVVVVVINATVLFVVKFVMGKGIAPLLAASNWYTNTGATAHMTNFAAQLDKFDTYTSKDRVIVDNGASLPISHTGILSPTFSLTLKDVLIVPGLTKNMISISKLTFDFPFSTTFTNDRFIIQNQVTRKVVATGWREDDFMCLSVDINL